MPCKQTAATEVPNIASRVVGEKQTTEVLRREYIQIPEEPNVSNHAIQLVGRPEVPEAGQVISSFSPVVATDVRQGTGTGFGPRSSLGVSPLIGLGLGSASS